MHKFNTVYGDTLTMPQIILPSNNACMRLPGTDGKAKMSKSLGNFFTVREAAAVYGYDCSRMFMLMSHYRSPLNYSGEILMQAKAALERLRTARRNLEFIIANGRAGALSEADAAFVQGLDQYR